jgi:hypothetical protein
VYWFHDIGGQTKIMISINNLYRAPLAGATASVQLSWEHAQGGSAHLPSGATRVTSERNFFKAYIIQHAESWYRYANHTHQPPLDLPSGALYLVTGFDKTARNWMVGAFTASKGKNAVCLDIGVSNVAGVGVSYNYSWRNASRAPYRVAPRSVAQNHMYVGGHDTMQIDHPNHAENVEGPFNKPNGFQECIFVQGYRILVRKKGLTRTTWETTLCALEALTPSQVVRMGTLSPLVMKPNQSSSAQNSVHSSPSSRSLHERASFPLELTSDLAEAIDMKHDSNEDDLDADLEVELEAIPGLQTVCSFLLSRGLQKNNLPVQPFHPSDILNCFLSFVASTTIRRSL